MPGAALERVQGSPAYVGVAVVRCCGSERGEATAPAVVGGGSIGPAALAVHAVVPPAVGGLTVEQELEGESAQPVGVPCVGFPRGDGEEPGVVVGAVAVLEAPHRAVGVLEQAAVVAHPVEVIEAEGASVGHMATASRVRTRPSTNVT